MARTPLQQSKLKPSDMTSAVLLLCCKSADRGVVSRKTVSECNDQRSIEYIRVTRSPSSPPSLSLSHSLPYLPPCLNPPPTPLPHSMSLASTSAPPALEPASSKPPPVTSSPPTPTPFRSSTPNQTFTNIPLLTFGPPSAFPSLPLFAAPPPSIPPSLPPPSRGWHLMQRVRLSYWERMMSLLV